MAVRLGDGDRGVVVVMMVVVDVGGVGGPGRRGLGLLSITKRKGGKAESVKHSFLPRSLFVLTPWSTRSR